MDEDRVRWDRRHQRALDGRADADAAVTATPPDVVRDVPELADRLPTTGRGLDVACGTGSVALWLGARGLDVVGLDVSPVAIAQLRDASVRFGLDDRVEGRVADLDEGLPHDLVELDVIMCQRFRDPSLYPVMLDRLRLGGMACITVLSVVGADSPGPFHAPEAELLAAFTSDRCDVLHHHEGDGLASIVVRRR